MDKYERIKTLGQGSYGKVFLIRHRLKGQLFCLKYIRLKNMTPVEREACRAEVELLKKLDHPNIVQFEESFVTKNGGLCIVMDYCDGGDLGGYLKATRGRKTEAQIMHHFVQIALGLQHMHEHRILHRDIKLQNIFLSGKAQVVLGDLGISKVLNGTMDFAKTCIGTPYYMSPEIFNNETYDLKSDVWALGCVLYEMITSKHAFDARSFNALAAKISKGRFTPIGKHWNRHIRSLVNSMLALKPSDRPTLTDILKRPYVRKHLKGIYFDTIQIQTPRHENLRRQLESIGMNAAELEIADEEDEKPVRKIKRLSSQEKLCVDALERENYRQQVIKGALARNRQQLRQPKPKSLADDPRVIAQRVALQRTVIGPQKIVRAPLTAADLAPPSIPVHLSPDSNDHRAKVLARKEAKQRAEDDKRMEELQNALEKNRQLQSDLKQKHRAQYKSSHSIEGISSPREKDSLPEPPFSDGSIAPSQYMMKPAVSFDDWNNEDDPVLTEADWEATEQLMQQREIQLKAELQESELRCNKLRESAAAEDKNHRRPGRLEERIGHLKEECAVGLGQDMFMNAYTFLKESETSSIANPSHLNELQKILGNENYSAFAERLDQLIFMERSFFD